MKNITNKKPTTTGSRIEQLLKDKKIAKKVFAIDMGVSAQTVSNWISDKYSPGIEHLCSMSLYLDTTIDYLTCQTDYKNINELNDNKMKKHFEESTMIQTILASRGYYRGSVKGFYGTNKKDKYAFKELIENNFIYDSHDDNALYEITTPKGQKKYIKRGELIQLYNDFFTLLESRLIDNIPE